MTTALKGSTVYIISKILSIIINYDDADKYEVLLYNSSKGYIKIKITRNSDGKEMFYGDIADE